LKEPCRPILPATPLSYKARNEDPEKVKFVTEEVLFPLRQRFMDMQQMIVVNQQGVMATEIVIRNDGICRLPQTSVQLT
jgi:uncharacterized protein YaaN involved in tellurite resistance